MLETNLSKPTLIDKCRKEFLKLNSIKIWCKCKILHHIGRRAQCVLSMRTLTRVSPCCRRKILGLKESAWPVLSNKSCHYPVQSFKGISLSSHLSLEDDLPSIQRSSREFLARKVDSSIRSWAQHLGVKAKYWIRSINECRIFKRMRRIITR